MARRRRESRTEGRSRAPASDRSLTARSDDLGDVVAGRFGGAQSAPEPRRLRRVQLGRITAGGKRGGDAAAVALAAKSCSFAFPDGEESCQVVGVGQGAPQGGSR